MRAGQLDPLDDMWRELVGYGLIGGFVLLWVVGVVAWGFAAYYMIKTLNRFHPERTWGKFIPVSLFMPWFFTDDGNKYRVKLLWASAAFLACVAGGFAIGLITEAITGNMSSNPSIQNGPAQAPAADFRRVRRAWRVT